MGVSKYPPDSVLTSDKERRAFALWCVHKILGKENLQKALCRIGSLEDAIQVAEMAIVKAAKRWDPKRGKLNTIAFYVARTDLKRAIEHGGVIYRPFRPPTKELERHAAVEYIRSLENKTGQLTIDMPWPERELAEDVSPLLGAIKELPKEDQELLRLRYWDGLGLKDIGWWFLGVCKERVRQRLEAVLGRLKKQLPENTV